MSGRVARVLGSVGEFVRTFFSGEVGVVPAVRDKGGTFGTQRMNIKARSAARKEKYPTD